MSVRDPLDSSPELVQALRGGPWFRGFPVFPSPYRMSSRSGILCDRFDSEASWRSSREQGCRNPTEGVSEEPESRSKF